MSNIICGEMYKFANANKALSICTLGIAIAVYGLVVWIRECCGTAQKVDDIADQRLKNKEPQSPARAPQSPTRGSLADRLHSLPITSSQAQSDEAEGETPLRSLPLLASPTAEKTSGLGTSFLAPGNPMPVPFTFQHRALESPAPAQGQEIALEMPVATNLKSEDVHAAEEEKPIDISKINYQGEFNSIFPTYKSDITPKRLQDLSTDQIYKLSKYFYDYHWKELTSEQISKLDFSKFEMSPALKIKIIKLLPIDQIYTIQEALNSEGGMKWKEFPTEKVHLLDFSKIKMNEEVYKNIFQRPRLENIIQKLPSESIHLLWKYFTWEWASIPVETIPNLDFTIIKMDEEIYSALFYGKTWTMKLSQITLDQLKTLQPYLKREQYGFVPVDLRHLLDFSKIEMDVGLFHLIFPFDSIVPAKNEAITTLDCEQIYMFQQYFCSEHWAKIPVETLKQLKREKLSPKSIENLELNLRAKATDKTD